MRIHNEVKSKTYNQVLEESTGKSAPDGRLFHCQICEKDFEEHLLHTHNAMHKSKGQFNCFICNRSYDSEVHFNIHMKVHDEQGSTFKPGRSKAPHNMNLPMPYPCGYCDKKFSKPHEKVKHERVHTGEKPYKCEVCGKCFRVSYSLTLHLRTHTDIRPFVCAICNKRFVFLKLMLTYFSKIFIFLLDSSRTQFTVITCFYIQRKGRISVNIVRKLSRLQSN